MRLARRKRAVEEVQNIDSQGGEAEVALPAPPSKRSQNKSISDELRANKSISNEPRGDSRNSRDSRASFRLDASTMELDLAGQVPDTLEMTMSGRDAERESLGMGSDRQCHATPDQGVTLDARNTPRVLEAHQVPLPEPVAVSNPPPGKSGGATKARVTFSLVGRVKEKRRAREKGISFLQLGRLASLTPSLQTGPTLQQVVGKHFKEEGKAMLPPEGTTTPQTGARLAVAHWLNTVQTPDSLLAPTVLGNGTESPACTEPMKAISKSRACSTLVGSKRASSPPQASTVPTPKMDSTQVIQQGPMPDTLLTFKVQDKLTVEEKSVGAHNSGGEIEKDSARSCSIDLDAELAKVVADTGDDDPEKRLSFERKGELLKEVEMVSKRATEDVISVGDDDEEGNREGTEIEQSKEVVMVDEESRELPEVEDDFLEQDAIEEDFMAKIVDTQAELAFTQQREEGVFKQGGEEDGLGEEEDLLGKRGRQESDDEEEPVKAPFKRFRRIESDDEDDTRRESDEKVECEQPDADEMEVGKSTQEVIEAMAQAAEEVSQVRREVEQEMENDLSESRAEGRPSVDQSEKLEEEKAGLEEDNFDLSEECDFLPDQEAVEEKEIFEKYEQAAADAPSQEPSFDDAGNPEDIKMEEEEVEEKPIEAASTLDSEDGGPGSDVRVIPESDEDFFSQTSNPGAAQGHPAASSSRCSPIIELSENESEVLGNSQESEEILGNSQKGEEEVDLPDTSKWRFAFSNLSSSARAELPKWADSLGCRGLHSKVSSEESFL